MKKLEPTKGKIAYAGKEQRGGAGVVKSEVGVEAPEAKVGEVKYQTKIMMVLSGLEHSVPNPDAKHNMGNLLGELFLWRVVKKYAEGKVTNAEKGLEDRGILKKRELEPGEHLVTESPSFAFTAKVSEKVRRFSPEALAKVLFERFKVPIPVALHLIDEAKVPTNSTVTLNLIEK